MNLTQKKQSILLAEDDAALQTALMKALRKEGYHVCGASDGEEALAVFSKRAFDLVITDLSMPKKKGLEVVAEVKRQKPSVPVIIITAFGEWDTYQEAVNQSVFEYVNKPVKKEELLKLVHTALLSAKGDGVPVGPSGCM